MDSFNKFTQDVSKNWSPFAKQVGKSFTQYRQMANERLGSQAAVTELPTDYQTVEKRFEAVRQSSQSLLRLAKAYVTPPAHFDVQALQHQFTTLTARLNTKRDAEQVSAPEQPPNTHQHGLARASLEVSEQVGLEEPLGAALFKFGSIEEKVGSEKLKQDKEIQTGFIQPLMESLESGLALAQNSRKEVLSARLAMDAAKAAFKAAKPGTADESRREVEAAEDHFIASIEEATKLMTAVIESPEHLRQLTKLVNAQLAFHREAAALLADLAPEIEEIRVTQEALYRREN